MKQGILLILQGAPDVLMPTTEQPNILFVFADQLRPHNLGCYGDALVETPNFDRLAKEGVRFSHAISTHPVCGPFRGMLMTGNFPIKNGLILTDHYLKNPDPYFAEVCQASGYRTGYIGKWHLDGAGRKAYIPPERRLGFEHWRALECTHKYFESEYYHDDERSTRTWEDYDAISQTEDACQYIEKQDDPFCLFLSWGPPHGPYDAPQSYMEKWKGRDFPLRENVDDFSTGEKLWEQCDTTLPKRYEGMRAGFKERQLDKGNAVYREQTIGYLASIEVLDDCMGKILKTLETQEKLENTIVVFTSDHGDNLGSHRQTGKQLPFEESISIPFIIRYPEKCTPGQVCEKFMRPIDMMPTLMNLAGVPCHEVDGQAVILNDKEVGDECDGVLIQKCLALSTNWIANGNGPWVGVRTKTHTYARLTNSNTPWMLFDNIKDPYQMSNLIGNIENAEIQKKLDEKTTDLLSQAGEPEDPEAYARIIREECEAKGDSSRGEELIPTRL